MPGEISRSYGGPVGRKTLMPPWGETMYPTMEQVEVASREQLANWYRFLPSPGMNAKGGYVDFEKLLAIEAPIMDRICERFKELGGMNPQISKSIGWEN